MISHGNVPLNSVIPFYFDSFDGGTGASITLTGIAITDVEIFKGTSMTQRASDSGVVLLDTDGIDVDLITGIHGFSIDTSDNADAGFYAAGSFYTVVVASVTIDAQTVNFVAGTFRLVAIESVAGVPEVDLTHVAGSTTNVSTLATDVQAIIVDTADMQPKLGTPAGVSMSADIAVIEAQTDDIGVAGAGLTDLGGMSTTMKAQVETEVDDALGGGTGTALTAIPWNATWDAEVQSEVDDALVAQRLDELVNADSDIDGLAPPTVGSVFHELLSKTAGSFTFDQTTDSNEAIKDAIPAAAPTAAVVADAVWDEAIADHAGAGSTGLALSGASAPSAATVADAVWDEDATAHQTLGSYGQAIGDPVADTTTIYQSVVTDAAGTHVAADIVAVKADTAAILTDTGTTLDGRIPAALVSGRMDSSVGAMAANVMTASALAADAVAEIWTTALTEAYNADGVAPTAAQALFVIMQRLTEFAIAGVTLTAKKLDGVTTAFTLTFDDATDATSSTRAT